MRSLMNLIVTTNTATCWAVVGGALSPPQTSSHPLLEDPPPPLCFFWVRPWHNSQNFIDNTCRCFWLTRKYVLKYSKSF